MKHTICYIFLWVIYMVWPQKIGRTQDSIAVKMMENKVIQERVDIKAKKVLELATNLPDTVVIVKPKTKVVYIKLNEAAPKKKYANQYIAVEETKLKLIGIDSVDFKPAIKTTSNKKGIFHRIGKLFKRKKKQENTSLL